MCDGHQLRGGGVIITDGEVHRSRVGVHIGRIDGRDLVVDGGAARAVIQQVFQAVDGDCLRLVPVRGVKDQRRDAGAEAGGVRTCRHELWRHAGGVRGEVIKTETWEAAGEAHQGDRPVAVDAVHQHRLGVDLQLRTIQAVGGHETRLHIVRQEPVEHARRFLRRLADEARLVIEADTGRRAAELRHLAGGIRAEHGAVRAAEGHRHGAQRGQRRTRGGLQCTQEGGELDERLLELAGADDGVRHVEGAGFVVEQDGLQCLAQVAVRGAIGVAGTVDVSGAGVRGDEALDELAGDEHGCVLVAIVSACGGITGEGVVGQTDIGVDQRMGLQVDQAGDVLRRNDRATFKRTALIRVVVEVEDALRAKVMQVGAVVAAQSLHRIEPGGLEVALASTGGEVREVHALELDLRTDLGRGGHVVITLRAQTCHRHRGVTGTVAEASEHTCEFGDVALVIGGNRKAVGTQHKAAVRMAQHQTDGEELHDLTGVVFVRENVHAAAGVLGAVAQMGEVDAHHRAVAHALEQVAILAERAVGQHVPVIGSAVVAGGHRAVVFRDDHDLAQGGGHALTHLGFGLQGHRPPLTAAVGTAIPRAVGRVEAGDVAAGGGVGVGDVAVGVVGGGEAVARELLVIAGVKRLRVTHDELFIIRRHDQCQEAGVRRGGGVHLVVQPVGVTRLHVRRGDAVADGVDGVDLGLHRSVEVRRCTEGALVEEAVDVTLGLGGGQRARKHGFDKVGTAWIKGGVAGGEVEEAEDFTRGVIDGVDVAIDLAGLQGIQHRLVIEGTGGSANVPLDVRQRVRWQWWGGAQVVADVLVIVHAQVGRVLRGAQAADVHADLGIVIVPFKLGHGDAGTV